MHSLASLVEGPSCSGRVQHTPTAARPVARGRASRLLVSSRGRNNGARLAKTTAAAPSCFELQRAVHGAPSDLICGSAATRLRVAVDVDEGERHGVPAAAASGCYPACPGQLQGPWPRGPSAGPSHWSLLPALPSSQPADARALGWPGQAARGCGGQAPCAAASRPPGLLILTLLPAPTPPCATPCSAGPLRPQTQQVLGRHLWPAARGAGVVGSSRLALLACCGLQPPPRAALCLSAAAAAPAVPSLVLHPSFLLPAVCLPSLPGGGLLGLRVCPRLEVHS